MKNNTRLTLKIYWQHLQNYKFGAFCILLSVVGASTLGAIVPLYFKKFFDVLASGVSNKVTVAPTLISILTMIAILELIRWVFWRFAGIFNNYVQPRVIASLSNFCFEYLHRHSFAFFNNNFVGALVKRVNWFTRSFESIADNISWNLIPLVVNLTVIIIVLNQKSIYLSLGVILWLIVFLIVNWFLTVYKLKFDIQRSEAETKTTAILADTITNNGNVKLFGGYQREVNTFTKAVELVRRLRTFTWNLDATFDGVQGFLSLILELGTIYLGVSLWKKNILTVGDFVLIQAYLVIILDKVWGFGKIIRQMYANLADAEEMTVILNTPHEIVDAPGAKDLVVTDGKVEFRGVSFNYYETRKVISDFNLTIKPKEKVALVGPSGAGKTTFIKLLLRMHEVFAGKILVDGQEINGVTQESLWHNISLVPQDPVLFHRTLIENIRYGKPEASDKDVIDAAKKAYCHEFIMDFPDKYQTYVGERGMKLSGGERQRVAIARAILRDAPILVLDEATSSLDSASEQLIQNALNNLMKNKTVIVVAHRLSTIMKMDRIIVVKDGKIIEEGTHQELLGKAAGTYQQLWKLQAGGFIK